MVKVFLASKIDIDKIIAELYNIQSLLFSILQDSWSKFIIT